MGLGAWLRRLFAFVLPPEEAADEGPVEVFESAIRAARQRFLELRATASPLYEAREALGKQEKARAAELAELAALASAAMDAGNKKEALELASRHGRAEAEVARVRAELAEVEKPLSAVEAKLRSIEGEVRELEAERDRSAAMVKGAEARIAVDRILANQASKAGVDAMELAAARVQIAGLVTKAQALEEISAGGTEAQMAAFEARLEEERAMKQLEGIRRGEIGGGGSTAPRLPEGSSDGKGDRA